MDQARVREAIRQGCIDPWAASVLWKDSPSAPPAPDYKGAAEATAKSQQSSQYTPYGSQVYSADPHAPSGYRSDITLTPQAQQALGSQLDLSSGLGKIAQGQLPGVAQQYSQPMGMQSVQDIADNAYGAMTKRLDPQWDARATQNETRLINQGLRPGDEAYTNASRDFNNARNDAYSQANLAAVQTMPQTYNLAAQQYQQPLNILNALRTGAQVQNPQFSQQPATNYLGAAQGQGQYAQGLYNADVGAANSANATTGALAGAGLMAAAFF